MVGGVPRISVNSKPSPHWCWRARSTSMTGVSWWIHRQPGRESYGLYIPGAVFKEEKEAADDGGDGSRVGPTLFPAAGSSRAFPFPPAGPMAAAQSEFSVSRLERGTGGGMPERNVPYDLYPPSRYKTAKIVAAKRKKAQTPKDKANTGGASALSKKQIASGKAASEKRITAVSTPNSANVVLQQVWRLSSTIIEMSARRDEAAETDFSKKDVFYQVYPGHTPSIIDPGWVPDARASGIPYLAGGRIGGGSMSESEFRVEQMKFRDFADSGDARGTCTHADEVAEALAEEPQSYNISMLTGGGFVQELRVDKAFSNWGSLRDAELWIDGERAQAAGTLLTKEDKDEVDNSAGNSSIGCGNETSSSNSSSRGSGGGGSGGGNDTSARSAPQSGKSSPAAGGGGGNASDTSNATSSSNGTSSDESTASPSGSSGTGNASSMLTVRRVESAPLSFVQKYRPRSRTRKARLQNLQRVLIAELAEEAEATAPDMWREDSLQLYEHITDELEDLLGPNTVVSRSTDGENEVAVLRKTRSREGGEKKKKKRKPKNIGPEYRAALAAVEWELEQYDISKVANDENASSDEATALWRNDPQKQKDDRDSSTLVSRNIKSTSSADKKSVVVGGIPPPDRSSRNDIGGRGSPSLRDLSSNAGPRGGVTLARKSQREMRELDDEEGEETGDADDEEEEEEPVDDSARSSEDEGEETGDADTEHEEISTHKKRTSEAEDEAETTDSDSTEEDGAEPTRVAPAAPSSTQEDEDRGDQQAGGEQEDADDNNITVNDVNMMMNKASSFSDRVSPDVENTKRQPGTASSHTRQDFIENLLLLNDRDPLAAGVLPSTKEGKDYISIPINRVVHGNISLVIPPGTASYDAKSRLHLCKVQVMTSPEKRPSHGSGEGGAGASRGDTSHFYGGEFFYVGESKEIIPSGAGASRDEHGDDVNGFSDGENVANTLVASGKPGAGSEEDQAAGSIASEDRAAGVGLAERKSRSSSGRSFNTKSTTSSSKRRVSSAASATASFSISSSAANGKDSSGKEAGLRQVYLKTTDGWVAAFDLKTGTPMVHQITNEKRIFILLDQVGCAGTGLMGCDLSGVLGLGLGRSLDPSGKRQSETAVQDDGTSTDEEDERRLPHASEMLLRSLLKRPLESEMPLKEEGVEGMDAGQLGIEEKDPDIEAAHWKNPSTDFLRSSMKWMNRRRKVRTNGNAASQHLIESKRERELQYRRALKRRHRLDPYGLHDVSSSPILDLNAPPGSVMHPPPTLPDTVLIKVVRDGNTTYVRVPFESPQSLSEIRCEHVECPTSYTCVDGRCEWQTGAGLEPKPVCRANVCGRSYRRGTGKTRANLQETCTSRGQNRTYCMALRTLERPDCVWHAHDAPNWFEEMYKLSDDQSKPQWSSTGREIKEEERTIFQIPDKVNECPPEDRGEFQG
ncbi:unnamed protein product [Amoebophrya sp. A25]|nr:unnamed protein product [Amoebophrya sp. A25]|eukprot:GSA25T00006793001.1